MNIGYKHCLRLLAAWLLLATYQTAFADTWYVTDKVLVGLYAEATTSSVLIKSLPTGTPLEVLEKGEGFWLVKEANGKSGWIEASYLIEHKPAQEVVLELSDKNEQANAEVKKLRKALGKAEKEIKQLTKDLKQKQPSGKNNDTKLKTLTRDNEQLKQSLADLEKKLASSQAELTKQTAALEKAKAAKDKSAADADAAASPAEMTGADGNALREAEERIENLKQINQDLSEKINGVLLLLDGKAVAQPVEPVSLDDLRNATRWQGRDLLYLLGMLLLGLVGGFFLFDYVNRKRHGGFRI